MTARPRGAKRPDFTNDHPHKEGAGNTGCVLHPRSRVQICAKKRTRAKQVQTEQSGIPCAMVYGLCRALPGDEFVLSPSLANQGLAEPGWARKTSASLAPATGVGTTRFCRTRDTSFVLRAAGSLTSLARPATAIAPTLSRPPHPVPRS